jgi:hypothetical protein
MLTNTLADYDTTKITAVKLLLYRSNENIFKKEETSEN